VLGSEPEAFRLGLVTATKAVIARSLDLIGVDAPDTM
jgi:arginyl-tRNA synthetase